MICFDQLNAASYYWYKVTRIGLKTAGLEAMEALEVGESGKRVLSILF